MLPNSRVACKINLDTSLTTVLAFYRYNIIDFNLLLTNMPKKLPALICGDINFPETNWKTLMSSKQIEEEVLDIFDEKFSGKQ